MLEILSLVRHAGSQAVVHGQRQAMHYFSCSSSGARMLALVLTVHWKRLITCWLLMGNMLRASYERGAVM
jgi:hypothetical protein